MSPAEIIQIIFGAIQIALAWVAIRHQSEPRKAHGTDRNEVRRSTSFIRSIEWFDAFAFAMSVGALLAAALLRPAALLPWAQNLLSYFFIALASTLFALTVVRVQANRFSKDLTHTLNNLNLDGGEF